MKFIYKSDIEDDDIEDLDIDDDIEGISKAQEIFANELYDVIQSFINSDTIKEDFKSESALKIHFDRHCVGMHKDKKSKRTGVYYDFKYISQYREYENFIYNHVNKTPLVISNLYDTDTNIKYFHKLFEGGTSLYFSYSCGFKKNNKSIILGLYAFSTDKTTNYMGGNTISLIAIDKSYTSTVYPIDANYLETKLNNIIKKYSDLDMSLKYNR